MKKTMIGVVSKQTKDNVVLSNSNSIDDITLYKDKSYVRDNAAYVRFIKNIEYQVRTSSSYSGYIYYLKKELDPPLNHCMVYSNITDDIAPIEMHHGPIWTMFDYAQIIANWLFKKNNLISTVKAAELLMEEHLNNRIQVVMLSKLAHNQVHPSKSGIEPMFLNYKSAHGDIVGFIDKYFEGLDLSHMAKMQKYLDSYETNMGKKDEFLDDTITIWMKD